MKNEYEFGDKIKKTYSKEFKKRYIAICEIAYGSVPIDIEWAVNTLVFKKAEEYLIKIGEI